MEENLNQSVNGLEWNVGRQLGELEERQNLFEENLNQRVDSLERNVVRQLGDIQERLNSIEERNNQIFKFNFALFLILIIFGFINFGYDWIVRLSPSKVPGINANGKIFI